VVLFLMLTGRLPFQADDALTLASLHVTEAAPSIAALRPDAPPRLESLATAALAKDPADRPPDGAALVAELEGIGGVPAAGAATTDTRPAVGRRRLGPTGVAVALVALLAAGTLVAFALSDDPVAPAAGTSAATTQATTAPAGAATQPGSSEEPPSTASETTAPSTAEAPPTTEAPTTEAPVTVTEPPTVTELPPITEPPPPTEPTTTTVATTTLP
jgi:eukaryotic-like serine/threonine-protein kinase